MLDGRIDAQGTLNELRAWGVLDDIEHDAATDVKQELVSSLSEGPVAAEDLVTAVTTTEDVKKARKLVKDEHRETGGVKWSVYNTYLKASYVSPLSACLHDVPCVDAPP